VLIDEASGIIAGHGRVLAAQKLGILELRNWLDQGAKASLCAGG
jgi:hypothetical protein